MPPAWAGLTAGALWAQQGKRVLVIERHDKFSGAATMYERKRLEIGVGLHELYGFGEHNLSPHQHKSLHKYFHTMEQIREDIFQFVTAKKSG